MDALTKLRQRLARLERDNQELVRHRRLLLPSRENAHSFAFLEEYGADAEELVRRTLEIGGATVGGGDELPYRSTYDDGFRWPRRDFHP